MIELKENEIKYYVDHLIFGVKIDQDNDVTFYILDKNKMDFIYAYIINEPFEVSTNMTKEDFLQSQLINNVCDYYKKEKDKFLDEILCLVKKGDNIHEKY